MLEKRRLQVCENLKLQFSNGADVGVTKNVIYISTTTPNGRILEKNYDSQNFFLQVLVVVFCVEF